MKLVYHFHPVAQLILSLFTGSFGIMKFFLKGPLPILPLDAPLAGVLSFKFLVLLLLNTMFVVRTFSIEASLFTSYRHTYYTNVLDTNNVDPIIPEEYRLVIYLLPALLSFVINLIRLAITMKLKDFQYFKKFPQFLLCPMFSPLMFEGNQEERDDNAPPVRVWKLGSIVNSVFIGCLPQALLVAMDQYRQIPTWYRIVNDKGDRSDSNALIKHPYGSTVFGISSLLLYLFFIIIFFAWDKIFKTDGCLCNLCKSIFCSPCLNPCHKPQPEVSDPSTVDNQDDPEQGHELSIRDSHSSESILDVEGQETNAEVLINCH